MDGILKVTPEKLISSSEEFSACGNQVKALTSEMMELVQGLSAIWQGEASSAFKSRFATLQTDMDKLYRMVAEHSKDLGEMAASYLQAESGSTEQSNGMRTGVVV
ncbi:MAG: WXG100 family type VII secretion target [Lachnospiraceae bacterium]|nr:WXG100 family type VII secretion target [Lachnospiraceae bacterium]